MKGARLELPLQALYTIGELARASGLDRRRLVRVLQKAEVTFLMSGRVRLVSLAELEKKVPALWDGILAVYSVGGDRGDEP